MPRQIPAYGYLHAFLMHCVLHYQLRLLMDTDVWFPYLSTQYKSSFWHILLRSDIRFQAFSSAHLNLRYALWYKILFLALSMTYKESQCGLLPWYPYFQFRWHQGSLLWYFLCVQVPAQYPAATLLHWQKTNCCWNDRSTHLQSRESDDSQLNHENAYVLAEFPENNLLVLMIVSPFLQKIR